MDLKEMVEEFAECVMAQAKAMADNDWITGNQFAKRYVAAFETLRARGDEGRQALTQLLDDDRREVKIMAAAYLLRHSQKRAKAVLEAEARGNDLVAFGAAQALQRWADGTWSLDPE